MSWFRRAPLPRYQFEKLPDEILGLLENYTDGGMRPYNYAVLTPVLIQLDKRWKSKYGEWELYPNIKLFTYQRIAECGYLEHLRYFLGERGAAEYIQSLLDSGKEDCIDFAYRHCWFRSKYVLGAGVRVDIYERWKDTGFQTPFLADVVRSHNLPLFKYLTQNSAMWATRIDSKLDYACHIAFQGRYWEFIEYVISYPKNVEVVATIFKYCYSDSNYTDAEYEYYYHLLRRYYQPSQIQTALGENAPPRLKELLTRDLSWNLSLSGYWGSGVIV